MNPKDVSKYGAPGPVGHDFEARAAEFLDGLQALTKRTGIMIYSGASHCSCCEAPEDILELGDVPGHGRYVGDADCLEWLSDDEIAAREKRRLRAEKAAATRKAKRAAAGQ